MAATENWGVWGLELGDLAGMPDDVFNTAIAPKLREAGVLKTVAVEAIDAPPRFDYDTLVEKVG